jgi:hypothetical protein
MSKIIDGAKEALAFVRWEGPAARITTSIGGPYLQRDRPLIQHHVGDHYIVWNWATGCWDSVLERVQIIEEIR